MVLDEATDRVPGRMMHTHPQPQGLMAFVHGGNDRLYVLLWEQYGPDPWRIWRLSTGEELPEVLPGELMPQVEKVRRFLREARELRGTELSLLHWWVNDYRDFSMGYCPQGGTFALVRPGGAPLWVLECPRDYTVRYDERADDRLECLVNDHGAILDVATEGRFSLWFVQQEQRVDFRAVRDPETIGAWRVEETGRSDFAPSGPHLAPPPPGIELERVARARLNSSELLDPGPAKVDHLGRVLIQDLGTGTVHVFDREGRCLFSCEPDPADVEHMTSIGRIAVSREGGVFVEIEERGWGHIPLRYLRFSPGGSRMGPVDLGDGWVVFQPGTDQRWIADTYGWEITLVDAENRNRERILRRADGRWLENIWDCAAGPDGSLLVLDGEGKSDLVLYDPQGAALEVIPLPDAISKFRVALSRDWIWVGGSGPGGTLLRRSDGSMRGFAAGPTERRIPPWTFGFSPDGRELWGIEGKALTLHRFALPDE